jgi:hypothetical protein
MMMIEDILECAEQALANLEGIANQEDINAIQRLINFVQEEY